MAPPIALSNVAGTLALSFTAGRAAPAEPPPIQQPTSVPAPPTLPPETGETPAPPSTPTTPEPSTAVATPEPSTPEPPVTPAEPPLVGPVEPSFEEEVEVPTAPVVTAPRLLRPNQRKLMFSLFVGGSKALRGGYSYFGGSEFKAEAAIGGFDDRFRVGGFAVVQVNAGFPLSSFTFAPRLSLNRQIIPGYAFYFNTNVTLGYRLTTYSAGYDGGYYYDGYGNGYSYEDPSNVAYHSGVLGVSWGASAIIAERLQLSFRPLDLELVAPAPGVVQINWSAMGGIGVLFGKLPKER